MIQSSRLVALALLIAVPIELLNLFLATVMLDPGPPSTSLGGRLLGAEWVFFHFIGFRLIDWFHYHLFGTERVGLVAAFVLGYLQTAVVFYVLAEGIMRLRRRSKSSRLPGEAC